jgi:hypothetical protein
MASLAERILARLEEAESHELNPHFQSDLRIAWITVLRAERGQMIPHISATYAVLGLHPERVWPAIVARRKAQCGAYYEVFYPGDSVNFVGDLSLDGLSQDLPPKKPVQSVRLARYVNDGRNMA